MAAAYRGTSATQRGRLAPLPNRNYALLLPSDSLLWLRAIPLSDAPPAEARNSRFYGLASLSLILFS
jgi:hypothetical protein